MTLNQQDKSIPLEKGLVIVINVMFSCQYHCDGTSCHQQSSTIIGQYALADWNIIS